MRGIVIFAHHIALDIQEATARHFDLFYRGTKPVGLHLRLPFTRLSAWIELREASIGLGHERHGTTWEFFAGRLQGVLCIEPVAAR